MGYQLDWQQFGGERTGRREDCVFLLPGGFIKTADMIMGKAASAGAGAVLGTVSVTEVKV